MQYREIPNSDLKVSVIGLGTMTWGEQNSREEAFAQADYALENGVNLIDTAEMYPIPTCAETCHETERILGAWLADRGTRDRVLLATKAAGPPPHISHIRENNHFDQKNLTLALEGSLERLRTDYVDLYQLHWPDRKVPLFGSRDFSIDPSRKGVEIEETLEVLGDFVKQGKVRHIGISNETPWGAMRFLELARDGRLPRVVTIQNSYNLLNRSFDTGLSEICYEEGLRLLAYSPLAFGRLTGKYRGGALPKGSRLERFTKYARYSRGKSDEAIEAYAHIAEAAGLDFGQMSLAWINRQPHLASNLVGATKMEQLRLNIASASLELSPDVLRAIEEVHRQIPNPCP